MLLLIIPVMITKYLSITVLRWVCQHSITSHLYIECVSLDGSIILKYVYVHQGASLSGSLATALSDNYLAVTDIVKRAEVVTACIRHIPYRS